MQSKCSVAHLFLSKQQNIGWNIYAVDPKAAFSCTL